MKKIALITLITSMFLTGFDFYHEPEPPMPKMYATAYCLKGNTFTGKKVRKGIAATGDKTLIGKTVLVYQRLPNGDMGDFVGIYEVEDTGCKQNVLDVWQPDLDSCQAFMELVYKNDCKGKVYCFFIDAKG